MAEQPAPRRRKGAAALSSLVTPAVGPAFARRGFAGADLAVHWPDIIGAGMARYCRPLELKWPRGGAEHGMGATLVVAVHASFALDVQQMAPVIIERINQRQGWRCVERITLQQRPVVPPPAPKPLRRAPDSQDIAAAGRIAAEIRADRLRDALTRLGAATIARSRSR